MLHVLAHHKGLRHHPVLKAMTKLRRELKTGGWNGRPTPDQVHDAEAHWEHEKEKHGGAIRHKRARPLKFKL